MFPKLPPPAPQEQAQPRVPTRDGQETVANIVAALKETDVWKWAEAAMNKDLGRQGG